MSLLLLVDGHAYAYRAFHAIRSLNGPSGKPTNAIYGFVKMLGRMLVEQKPTHLVVVWDGGLSRERMDLLPEYKAQRPPMPDALSEQIGVIMKYLEAAQIASLQQDGVEADDLIASLAVRAVVDGSRVVIASADKDFFQLVSGSVMLLNPNDKTGRVWGPDEVVVKTGVRPEQIVDWLSLVGDAVDNVPGVAGVGSKTAGSLLGQFGSVDGIYSHLSEVGSGRLRESLRSSELAVRRNQRMIRLKSDLADLPAAEVLAVRKPDYDRLIELYRQWGFRGLTVEAENLKSGQADLFD